MLLTLYTPLAPSQPLPSTSMNVNHLGHYANSRPTQTLYLAGEWTICTRNWATLASISILWIVSPRRKHRRRWIASLPATPIKPHQFRTRPPSHSAMWDSGHGLTRDQESLRCYSTPHAARTSQTTRVWREPPKQLQQQVSMTHAARSL